MYERHLEIDIRLIADDLFDVTLYETETGDSVTYTFYIGSDSDVVGERIGSEILGWLETLIEEKQQEDNQ